GPGQVEPVRGRRHRLQHGGQPEVRRSALALVALAVLAGALAGARGSGGSSHYSVGAVFSNAAGLIPGQNVEIAGAVVGSVKSIKLTPQHRALVQMDVQTGFAPGRPHDLQLAIKRANPALQESEHLLALVNRDRGLLGRLIDRSDTVLAQLAPHDKDVARFIDRANAATADVAGHRDALGTAIDRL